MLIRRQQATPGDVLRVRCLKLRYLLAHGFSVDEFHELVCEIHGLTIAASHFGQGALA